MALVTANSPTSKYGIGIKLKGKENFPQWKFLTNLLLESERLSCSSKKKETELEVRLQTVIALSVSERILPFIADLKSADEMMQKLENLYGLSEDDLEQLHTQFQNFRFDNNINLHENISNLETTEKN